MIIWVCLKIEKTPKPNGFADHYPYFLWLFVWEYTLFSDKPIWVLSDSELDRFLPKFGNASAGLYRTHFSQGPA